MAINFYYNDKLNALLDFFEKQGVNIKLCDLAKAFEISLTSFYNWRTKTKGMSEGSYNWVINNLNSLVDREIKTTEERLQALNDIKHINLEELKKFK